MNLAVVDKIAKAVLYEGYMLYPYRPSSVKNRQRWNFGVICPQAYSEAQRGSEAWTMQTECLVEASSLTAIEIRVRFLQLVERTVGELITAVDETPSAVPKFRHVERLAVNGRIYQTWQEAVEREVIVPLCNIEALGVAPVSEMFEFLNNTEFEYLRDGTGPITGVLVRDQSAIDGVIEVSGERVGEELFKIGVIIRNSTSFPTACEASRESALLRSLVSAHTVMGVHDGKFVSSLAPQDAFTEAAAGCKNIGTWPVLVGDEGQCDCLLSSPIILYDYPQIAPESAGELFDGTEIDEILSLRIMTLTDEEKREMSQSDERARQMLERTENMPAEQFMKLHGVLRGLRPVPEETR